MPTYGSTAAVQQLLRANVTSTFNQDALDRIDALLATVSALIEQLTGRQFGTGATSETVVIAGSHWFPFPSWRAAGRLGTGLSDLLVLPKGVRTIASVTVGGVWDGSAYTDGTALTVDQYQPVYQTRTGEYLALRLVDGSSWGRPVAIAGTWEDTDADNAVPSEITYLANFLAAERFKVEMSSAAGQFGPDGAQLPIRNVLKDPLVTAIVDKWRISNEALVL